MSPDIGAIAFLIHFPICRAPGYANPARNMMKSNIHGAAICLHTTIPEVQRGPFKMKPGTPITLNTQLLFANRWPVFQICQLNIKFPLVIVSLQTDFLKPDLFSSFALN